MRVSVVALMFFLILGSPALAMEKMSKSELKKTTAQLASSPGHASPIVSPAVEGYSHIENVTPITGAVNVVQTATEPVSRVVNIVSDVNGFKDGASLGFF